MLVMTEVTCHPIVSIFSYFKGLIYNFKGFKSVKLLGKP